MREYPTVYLNAFLKTRCCVHVCQGACVEVKNFIFWLLVHSFHLRFPGIKVKMSDLYWNMLLHTDLLVDSRGTGNAFWPLWQAFPKRWPSTGMNVFTSVLRQSHFWRKFQAWQFILKNVFYSWAWLHMLWIPAFRKQSRFLWVQGQPDLHNEFQSNQELYIYSSTNPRHLDDYWFLCLLSTFKTELKTHGLWVTLLCQALCLPQKLSWQSFIHCVVSDPLMSHPGWWFPHLIITQLYVFIIPKSLIPSISSDTNPYQHTTQWLFLMYVHMCLHGVCVLCVCVHKCTHGGPRLMAGITLNYSCTLSRVSQKKKKNPELSQYGSSCRPACSGDLVSLRTISHTRPLGFWGFWGCLPSKHWKP